MQNYEHFLWIMIYSKTRVYNKLAYSPTSFLSNSEKEIFITYSMLKKENQEKGKENQKQEKNQLNSYLAALALELESERQNEMYYE